MLQICFLMNLPCPDRCAKTVRVYLEKYRKMVVSIRCSLFMYSLYLIVNDIKVYYVCFMLYLPKIDFGLFYFFLSAVLVGLVYWVMMERHATIQEYCFIYLIITPFSLTHVIK